MGGTSLEKSGSFDQKDARRGCTHPHIDKTCDLPEDVLCLCAVQDDFRVRCENQVPCHLNDEDVVGSSLDGDV